MIRRLIQRRRQREARAKAARLGMAAYVNLNTKLIGVSMRLAQWKPSRRDPDAKRRAT